MVFHNIKKSLLVKFLRSITRKQIHVDLESAKEFVNQVVEAAKIDFRVGKSQVSVRKTTSDDGRKYLFYNFIIEKDPKTSFRLALGYFRLKVPSYIVQEYSTIVCKVGGVVLLEHFMGDYVDSYVDENFNQILEIYYLHLKSIVEENKYLEYHVPVTFEIILIK